MIRPIAILLLVFSPCLTAKSTLVTPQWIAEQPPESLVFFHVGSEDSYGQAHIPGAVHVGAHSHLSHPGSHTDGALVLELPEPNALQEKLRNLGVRTDSMIVVYFAEDAITDATRVLFTLRWAGLGSQSVFLDGGMDEWKRAGFAVTQDPPELVDGNVVVAPADSLVVDAQWVLDHIPGSAYRLLDARSRAHYDGVQRSRGMSGHIPGAGSLPWTELVDHELKFKDSGGLASALKAAGVDEGDTVVTYCHIGQYATLTLLAAELLGHPVRLYDGAFQDWAMRSLPVSTASE